MSMEFYRRTVPRSRTTHKCEGCGNPIEVGEKYSCESGKWDGDFFARLMHLDCYEAMNDILDAQGDNEFTWDSLAEWWRDEKCCECKHRYLPCKPDDRCPAKPCGIRTPQGGCKDNECDEMTHIFWCAKWEQKEAKCEKQ